MKEQKDTVNIQINIDLDSTPDFDVAEVVRNIAEWIDRGFTSGYDPHWTLVEIGKA